MSRRIGSMIVLAFMLLAIMLCLLCGCRQEVSNEFVANIKSSLEIEYENSSAQEIMGQVISLKEGVLVIDVLERDMGDIPERDIPERDKPEKERPDLKKMDKPELRASKPPFDQLPPDIISNHDGKMVGLRMKKTGIRLQITVEDTTECLKRGKTVSSEEIIQDSVVYIEMYNNHAQTIRISGQSYNIIDE